MTEPGAGSDLRGIRTRAVPGRRRLDPERAEDVHLLRDHGGCRDRRRADRPRGRVEGLHALRASSAACRDSSTVGSSTRSASSGQDTAELFFRDVRVPAANVIGGVGRGLQNLMSHLPRERLGTHDQGVFAEPRDLRGDEALLCRPRRFRQPDRQPCSTSASSSPRCPPSWMSPRPTSTSRCSPTTPAS